MSLNKSFEHEASTQHVGRGGDGGESVEHGHVGRGGDGEERNQLVTTFNKVYETQAELETTDHPSNSQAFQDMIKSGIAKSQAATHMVNTLSLFSRNETVDEVATSDLKYLLLPAFLGSFTYRLMNADRPERSDILEQSLTYYRDFLRRCKDYEVPTDSEIILPPSDAAVEPDVTSQDPRQSFLDMSSSRIKKISSYRARQEKQKQVNNFENTLRERGGLPDEREREYYLLLLQLWIDKVQEDSNSILLEKQMLKISPEKFEEDKSQRKEPVKKFQPVVITRDKLQAQVFGMGYPSLPTISIEEAIEKEIREGKIILPNNDATESPDKKEDDDNDDDDDVMKLKKQRDWDDWKDDHRRGYGNTMNKG